MAYDVMLHIKITMSTPRVLDVVVVMAMGTIVAMASSQPLDEYPHPAHTKSSMLLVRSSRHRALDIIDVYMLWLTSTPRECPLGVSRWMVTPRGDIYGWRLEDDRSSAMADICRMEPMAAMAR